VSLDEGIDNATKGEDGIVGGRVTKPMSSCELNVLIVDDDHDLRELLEAALTEAGMRVRTASDGGQALAEVEAHRPDVVLLDMMMPGVDGMAVLDRLPVECAPPLPRIIAYSGFDELGELALRRGVYAFIRKPFDLDRLVEAVHAAAHGDAAPAGKIAIDPAAAARRERRREELLAAASFDDLDLRCELRRLVAWAGGYFGVPKAFVGVMRLGKLVVLAQSGAMDVPEDVPLDPSISYCPEVMRAESPLVVRDATSDPAFRRHPAARATPLRFYAGAPLLTTTRVSLGAFCLRSAGPFDCRAEDLAIMSWFAHRAADAIAASVERRPPSFHFAAEGVLSAEALFMLVDAELRAAERDGSATLLAVVDTPCGSRQTAAILAGVHHERLALSWLNPRRIALLMGASHRAEERLGEAERALAAAGCVGATGVASFNGETHRLFQPHDLLRRAEDARAEAASRGVPIVVHHM
jgi:CheY-like chemotaxis protein